MNGTQESAIDYEDDEACYEPAHVHQFVIVTIGGGGMCRCACGAWLAKFEVEIILNNWDKKVDIFRKAERRHRLRSWK